MRAAARGLGASPGSAFGRDPDILSPGGFLDSFESQMFDSGRGARLRQRNESPSREGEGCLASDSKEHSHSHAHDGEERGMALKVKALEQLLVEKGIVEPAAIDRIVELYEKRIGPRNGARVVARAWVDPAYKSRLLSDATAAIAELGYSGSQGENMVVLENTPAVHNLVVCTLCSCYPWPVLGLPPVWYKSPPYRSRAVKDPRGVLAEFGMRLPPETEVRVWDSNAELRYMVLPMRPKGSERLGEGALADLVTRDGMIGVAPV
jgi:nitrile hydratase